MEALTARQIAVIVFPYLMLTKDFPKWVKDLVACARADGWTRLTEAQVSSVMADVIVHIQNNMELDGKPIRFHRQRHHATMTKFGPRLGHSYKIKNYIGAMNKYDVREMQAEFAEKLGVTLPHMAFA
jgi:hypothetical protein